MKKMILATAILALTGIQAQASSASDSAPLYFECESAPNVDSSLKVFGLGHEIGQVTDLAIFVGDSLRAEDQGSYDSATGEFKGQIFDIVISREGTATIKAKLENPVLSVDQAESLVCQ